MTGNKAMKLWTAIVTAFLALFTALGLTTTATAATAVQETTSARNATACAPAPFTALWTAAYERSLPPTMKQRIRAEAHGSSPSCRHLPPADTGAEAETDAHDPGRLAAEP
ncbi:hypothetical protein JQK87_01940 [Streptomyces sp. G44]|uniref:DUF6344 domain-containing protein n=1 Tax=Streptomyces sp. G44 TaxID=2807632 RepID=UPI001961E064|nr:DUF6344 domain-containing protein [Streptomyces sp. G44]MBM7167201.1 hypothetical protein [Streptomyces sp. G44]